MRCPICDAVPAPAFVKHGHQIFACPACGHRLAIAPDPDRHVASQYSNDYFTGGGAGYADYVSEGPALRERGRRYGELLALHVPPGPILDVGAAAGFVLKGLEDAGWRGLGIEPNASMARYGREDVGVTVVPSSLEAFTCERPFRAVAMIQVIGHLQEPLFALQRARDLLDEQGHLLIEGWDRGSITARLFGRHWHEYSPPSVLHWFSAAGLRRLARAAGFFAVAEGHPHKVISAAHARSLIMYKLGRSPAAALASPVLKLVPGSLSIPYPFDDLHWMLFRKMG